MTARRIVLILWLGAFLVGTVTHLMELLAHGWMPYTFAPKGLNLFWTLLSALDPLVILLLLLRRNAGVLLGIGIMTADVAANSYTVYGLGFTELMMPLQAQTLFFGFVLCSFHMIWKRS